MTTYNQLLSDISNYMENESAELTAAAPLIVTKAELRVARDLRVQAFETQASGTIMTGDPFFDRPTDLLAPRYMSVTVSGERRVLQIKDLPYLFEYSPDDSLTGSPVYYAIYDEDTYRIAPVPDADYPYEFGYRRQLAALSTSNQTNYLTVNAYDALQAACLAEAARYVLDDRQASLINIWEGKYQTVVTALNALEQRAERDTYRVDYLPTER